MLQATDLPRTWMPSARAELRPSAPTVEGAAAGDKGRACGQRLAGGGTPARDRRPAPRVAPRPDPDPPTGPPPAFNVTLLEHMRELAVAAAQSGHVENTDRVKRADSRVQNERPEISGLDGQRRKPAPGHVDMKV